MPTHILMPALSPTMETGTLSKWLKAEGDEIRAGDVIAEIETDKATMEVEAVDEGRLAKIVVAEGEEGVKVNAVIAILAEEGEEIAENLPTSNMASATEEQAPPPSEQPKQPKQPIVGSADSEADQKPTESTRSNGADRVFASPLARRIAAERGIDLAGLTGSGPRGRVVKADVIGAADAPTTIPQSVAPSPPRPVRPASPGSEAVMALYADRPFQEIPLDNMRRTVAARLTEAKQTIPHFYLRREICLDEPLRVRARLNANASETGVKISVNDLIIKAAAQALQTVPDANTIWADDRILRLKPSDVAVAVAIDGGLFTPIVRDAETKTLSAISAEMKDLALRARARRLKPQEYQGGAFAISNLGMFGIESFDAVINPPHGSILAVGAGIKKPVIRDGEMTSATMMSVTLSVDHRVIDGALGAEFLAAIAGFLEDPAMMLL